MQLFTLKTKWKMSSDKVTHREYSDVTERGGWRLGWKTWKFTDSQYLLMNLKERNLNTITQSIRGFKVKF